MQGPLGKFHPDFHKIFSKGIVKDHDQDLHARTPKRISQDHHKRTCCCWSGPYKILIQEPTKRLPPTRAFIQAPLSHGICKIFMQGPLREDSTRISTRSSSKDVYGMMQGPLKEEFNQISISAFLCKNLPGNAAEGSPGPSWAQPGSILRTQCDTLKTFWALMGVRARSCPH